MNWKQKARIQAFVAALPKPLNYTIYYYLQRNFGTVGKINVVFDMRKAAELIQCIHEQSKTINGKTFMEIGTGRTVNTEIGIWLCGAEKLLAVDLNPYLRADLVTRSLDWIKLHTDEVRAVLDPVIEDNELFDQRLERLQQCESSYRSVLDLVCLEYRAPCDASRMDLDSQSIDYHISTNVLEHVPAPSIVSIFHEARRVLRDDGLTVHRVDPSDHFAHSDPSISNTNFLQYDQAQWDKLANNTFSYHNRLRAVDFYALLKECGVTLLSRNEVVDQRSLEEIKQGFPIDSSFKNYSAEELATTFFTFAGKFE